MSPWIIKHRFSQSVLTVPLNIESNTNTIGRATHTRPGILMFPSKKETEDFCQMHMNNVKRSKIIMYPVARKRGAEERSDGEMNETLMYVTKNFPTHLGDVRAYDDDTYNQVVPMQLFDEFDDEALMSLAIMSYVMYFYVDRVTTTTSQPVPFTVLKGLLMDPTVTTRNPRDYIVSFLQSAYES